MDSSPAPRATGAVLVTSTGDRVVACSAAASTMFGGAPADAIGRPLTDLVDSGAATIVERIAIHSNVDVREVLLLQPTEHQPVPANGTSQWLRALVYRGKEVQFVVDPHGKIVYVSDVADPPLGYAPAETIGASAFSFAHPADRGSARRLLEEAVTSVAQPRTIELRARARDGAWRWVELTVTNLLHEEAVRGLVVNMRDVSARRSMETALRESEARYRSIVETAQEGIWLIDESGRTLFANRSLGEIIGHEPARVHEMNVFDVVPEGAREEARRRLASRRAVGHEIYEIPFLRGDGESRWASVSASPLFINSEYAGSLLMISDITQRKQSDWELERRALYDDLTGLPNRTLLQDRLNQAMRRRDRFGRLAVFFIDLDDFKAVNDSYGHEVGDALLHQVAQRLTTVVRDGDTLARFAGDEFVMVCSEIDDELRADALARRMLRVITQPVQVDSYVIRIDASIGVALEAHTNDAARLLRDADLAMFEAKRHGRGRHVMFDPNTTRHARYHLEDVQDLRRALGAGEIEVFFQPQIQLDQGDICSVEALARWRHPQRGLLAPDQFIGLAEASGLIVGLGQLVLDQACAHAVEWLRPGKRRVAVSVNVSARQLDDDELPSRVRRALERTDLPPELLSLEITETAVMSDTGRANRVLRELHDAGIRLSIDDFGTGYSSLVHLKRLPVDEIKIDQTFVDGVDHPGEDRSIVAAVINMANALDLRIVGEGVETEAQAEALIDLGCGIAQGYLYGRPMDAETVGARIVDVDADGPP